MGCTIGIFRVVLSNFTMLTIYVNNTAKWLIVFMLFEMWRYFDHHLTCDVAAVQGEPVPLCDWPGVELTANYAGIMPGQPAEGPC